MPASEIDGSEEKDVNSLSADNRGRWRGQRYLAYNALPRTSFFHVTTAYDILRHKGVEVGKRDYLGTY